MLPKFDTNYKPTFQKNSKISKQDKHTHQKDYIKAQKIKLLKTGHKKINLNTKQKK